MFFLYFLTISIISLILPTLVVAPGRRPQALEHTLCNLYYQNELSLVKAIDRRALVQAYNIGQNGSLCMTTCRILSRGNIRPLDAIPSPDYITCASGPQYCFRGICSNAKEVADQLRKDRITVILTSTKSDEQTTMSTTVKTDEEAAMSTTV